MAEHDYFGVIAQYPSTSGLIHDLKPFVDFFEPPDDPSLPQKTVNVRCANGAKPAETESVRAALRREVANLRAAWRLLTGGWARA